MGSAWAALISYAVIMVLSWYVGKKYYPLPYRWGRMFLYGIVAAAMLGIGMLLPEEGGLLWLTYVVRTLLLVIYICILAWKEPIPVLSSRLHKLIKK